ncbi:MAG TPA: methyl-accepting chemotaxis protein [Bdellovibrionota bacterium]|nr:methyl-accepting chemotaxis protein [Bdellovibrionota bacterium]
MQKFASLSLKQKLLASVIPVLVLSIGTLSVISYRSAAKAIISLQEAGLEMAVKKTITELDTWLRDRERDAQLLALSTVFHDALQGKNLKEAEAMLREHHRLSPFYENVFLADSNGRLFLDSIDGKSIGVELQKLPNFKLSYEKAREGLTWVGNAEPSPATGRPVSLVTAPIMSRGKLLGIMGTPIELSAFSTDFVNQIKIGSSGYVFILDSTGLALAHPNKENILKTNFAQTEWGKVFLEKQSDFIRYTFDGIVKTGFFGKSQRMGWIVASTMPTDELYALVRNVQYISLGFGLLIVLFVSAIIVFLSKSVFSVVDRVASSLSAGADEVTVASRQVFTSGEALASSVSEQAAALQETSSAVEELTATVQRNADNAAKAQSISASSAETAGAGKTAVHETIVAIEEISKSTDELTNEIEANNKEIAGIVKVISSIAEKTKVINDIVFQTKLLSFNASVEAARAGDSGKGFAVVAEEVGNLAQMSGRAAEEIAQMLDESVKKVENVANNTKAKVDRMVLQGKTKVEKGVKVAQRCGEVLDQVVKGVSEVDQLVREVATASSEQARGITEIAKAVTEMEHANQDNSGAAQNTSSAAMHLANQAEIQRKTANELLCLVNGNCQTAAQERMDFNNAITVHTDWKIKLTRFLAKPDESLDPAAIAKDTACL